MRWDDWARYEWAKNVKIRQLFKGKLSLRPKEEQIVNCLEESKESGSKLTRMLRTLKLDHGMGPPKSWLVQETQSMLHKQCYIITTVTHFNLQMNSVTWHTVTLLEWITDLLPRSRNKVLSGLKQHKEAWMLSFRYPHPTFYYWTVGFNELYTVQGKQYLWHSGTSLML